MKTFLTVGATLSVIGVIVSQFIGHQEAFINCIVASLCFLTSLIIFEVIFDFGK